MLAIIRRRIFCLPVYCPKNEKIKIYRTIILPVVLCGCETWSFILREECSLTIFENRVVRRIFGPKRDEVTWERRILHTKELYFLYSSPNMRVIKSRRQMGRAYSISSGEARCVQGLVGKPEGWTPLGRPRHRWKDNIKMDLRDVGRGGID